MSSSMVNEKPQTFLYLESSIYEECGWSEQRWKDAEGKGKYIWAFSDTVGWQDGLEFGRAQNGKINHLILSSKNLHFIP